ncbi:hypothetical protein SNE40_019642 [Patella caerulea]|uniref:WAP domain-containing protein n=1 Tax=Patella caerulea TaxID=87958 RepID=A0AAN8J8U7_PATCE
MFIRATLLALCSLGIEVVSSAEYPCNLVDCRTTGCRIQQVFCFTSPCYPVAVCSGPPVPQQHRTCPIGEPVLDANYREITCSVGRGCPDGTSCASRFLGSGKCCWGSSNDKPGSCPKLPPGTVGTCVEGCRRDRDCVGNKKCCANGCGTTCQTPENVSGNVKAGSCPRRRQDYIRRRVSRCARPCLTDTDCTGIQKCCPAGSCGTICTTPIFGRPCPFWDRRCKAVA